MPMLSLSRRHCMEAYYVGSQSRTYPRYVYISSRSLLGHEGLPHGPLFSAVCQPKTTGQPKPTDRSQGPSRRPGATRWSPDYLVFAALLMVFSSGATLVDRFRSSRECLVDMFPQRRRPGRSYQGFVKAWRRLMPGMSDALKRHLRQCHQAIACRFDQRWGWKAFAADGSRVEVPRTAANEEAFGRAGRKKTGPQLFLTTLYHMVTGLPWDWTIGRGTESERDHLCAMLASLPTGSLIVADAGFTGFDLLGKILAHGHSFLIRVGANVSLLTKLGVEVKQDGDTVWLWPTSKRGQSPLKLRLIRLSKRVAGSSSMQMCLLTNVSDHRRLSDETAATFYRMRWGVELFYRAYKQTLEQHKLRSHSPHQAKWELQMGMLALLLLGLMSVDGIISAGKDPLSWSVAGALRIVRHAMATSQRWRRSGDVRRLLSDAVRDPYVRRASKRARDWPHKKREAPPGVPKIRPATMTESLAAQRVYVAA